MKINSNCALVFLYSAILAFLLISNPYKMYYDYGTSKGKFEDRGDSFGDYIARNTIKNHILGYENKGLFPIITDGYNRTDANGYKDFSYSPNKTRVNYTSIYGHIFLFSKVAQLLNLNSEKSIDVYIYAVRIFNAFMLSLVLMFFAHSIADKFHFNKTLALFSALTIFSSSAGFSFFCQNMYYCFWISLLPIAFFPKIVEYYRVSIKKYMVFVFLLSLIVFCRSFSMGPLFMIIMMACSVLFYPNSNNDHFSVAHIKISIVTALAVFGAVAFTLLLYTFLFFVDISFSMSFSDGLNKAFAGIRNFPFPNWIKNTPEGIVNHIVKIFNSNAIVFPYKITFSQFDIVVAFVIMFLLRIKSLTAFEVASYACAFGGCLSLYVITFNWTMCHGQFVWALFAMSFTLMIVPLLLFYFNLAKGFVGKALRKAC